MRGGHGSGAARRGLFLRRRGQGREERRVEPAAQGDRSVLGQPRRQRGQAGRGLHEGRRRRERRPHQEDRLAAGRRVDRPGQPRERGPRFHRGRGQGRPRRAAGPLQRAAPRLRPVLQGRRRRRQRVPGLGRQGRQGHRRPAGHRRPGAGRAAAPGGRVHAPGVPRGAVRPAEGRDRTAQAAARHHRLPGRGQRRLAVARRALRAAPAGGCRRGGRVLRQRLQLLPDRRESGVRQEAVREGRQQALRDRHQP